MPTYGVDYGPGTPYDVYSSARGGWVSGPGGNVVAAPPPSYIQSSQLPQTQVQVPAQQTQPAYYRSVDEIRTVMTTVPDRYRQISEMFRPPTTPSPSEYRPSPLVPPRPTFEEEQPLQPSTRYKQITDMFRPPSAPVEYIPSPVTPLYGKEQVFLRKEAELEKYKPMISGGQFVGTNEQFEEYKQKYAEYETAYGQYEGEYQRYKEQAKDYDYYLKTVQAQEEKYAQTNIIARTLTPTFETAFVPSLAYTKLKSVFASEDVREQAEREYTIARGQYYEGLSDKPIDVAKGMFETLPVQAFAGGVAFKGVALAGRAALSGGAKLAGGTGTIASGLGTAGRAFEPALMVGAGAYTAYDIASSPTKEEAYAKTVIVGASLPFAVAGYRALTPEGIATAGKAARSLTQLKTPVMQIAQRQVLSAKRMLADERTTRIDTTRFGEIGETLGAQARRITTYASRQPSVPPAPESFGIAGKMFGYKTRYVDPYAELPPPTSISARVFGTEGTAYRFGLLGERFARSAREMLTEERASAQLIRKRKAQQQLISLQKTKTEVEVIDLTALDRQVGRASKATSQESQYGKFETQWQAEQSKLKQKARSKTKEELRTEAEIEKITGKPFKEVRGVELKQAYEQLGKEKFFEKLKAGKLEEASTSSKALELSPEARARTRFKQIPMPVVVAIQRAEQESIFDQDVIQEQEQKYKQALIAVQKTAPVQEQVPVAVAEQDKKYAVITLSRTSQALKPVTRTELKTDMALLQLGKQKEKEKPVFPLLPKFPEYAAPKAVPEKIKDPFKQKQPEPFKTRDLYRKTPPKTPPKPLPKTPLLIKIPKLEPDDDDKILKRKKPSTKENETGVDPWFPASFESVTKEEFALKGKRAKHIRTKKITQKLLKGLIRGGRPIPTAAQYKRRKKSKWGM